MEVIHANEKITHAVLGRGETIEFKTSTSSQIIFLLSTGLYKYPKLATIREIICNGWDAHIVSGMRDCPLEIKIDREGILTIRDFGTGIPHELMGPVYCTAGDSTKKESDDETGGFGLGCKAPFAYVDHFRVTSYNGGKKTIYEMALSDSTKQGEPSAKVLHQSDTTETGIEVRIQLKQGDYHQMIQIIKRVVYYGDINATLNGEQLKITGMDEAGTDTSVVAPEYHGDLMHGHSIFVRYGAVVYPLEYNDDYHRELRNLQSIITHKFSGFNGHHLILRAPANSISMVPSREALLYNPRTTETIKQMIVEATDHLKAAMYTDTREIVTKINRISMERGNLGSYELLCSIWNEWLPGHKRLLDDVGNAHTPEQIAIFFVANHKNHVMHQEGMRNWYTMQIWNLVQTLYPINKVMAKKFLRQQGRIPNHQLVRDYITRPVVRALQNLVPDFDKRMFFSESYRVAYLGQWKKNRKWIKNSAQESMFDAVPTKNEAMAWLLDPLFVICYDTKVDRLQAVNKVMDNESEKAAFFIAIDRNRHDERAVFEALRKQGFRVKTACGIQREMQEDRRLAAQQRRAEYMAKLPKTASGEIIKKPKKTKNELPAMTNMLVSGKVVRDNWFKTRNPVMIDNPKYVLLSRASATINQDSLRFCAGVWPLRFINKYGANTGVTNTQATYDRFVAAGSIPLVQQIVTDAMAALASNARYEQFMMQNAELSEGYLTKHWAMNSFFNVIMGTQAFRKRVGLMSLTQEEAEMLELLEHLKDFHYHYVVTTEQHKILSNLFKDRTVGDFKDPAVIAIRAKLSQLENLGISSVLNNSSIFQLERTHPEAYEKFLDFVMSVHNLN